LFDRKSLRLIVLIKKMEFWKDLQPSFFDIRQMFQETCQQDYGKIRDWNQLLIRFQYDHDLFFKQIMRQSIKEAYNCFFKQFPQYATIDQYYQIMYVPTEKMSNDIPFKYVFGMDCHLYGWNMIGSVLEEMYYSKCYVDEKLIGMIYSVKMALESKMYRGEWLGDYMKYSVCQLYKELKCPILSKEEQCHIYESYCSKTIRDYELYEYELQYNGNLVLFLLLKKYHLYDEIYRKKRESILFHYSIKLFRQESNKDVSIMEMNPIVMHCIENAIQSKMIILDTKTKLSLEKMESIKINSKKEKWIRSLMPYHRITRKSFFINESNEPISPMYPHQIQYQNKTFYCIFELVYYILLKNIQSKNETNEINEYNKKDENLCKKMDILICDQYMDQMIQRYRKQIDKKYKSSYYQQIVRFLSSQEGILYPSFHSNELISRVHHKCINKMVCRNKKWIVPKELFNVLSIHFQHYQSIELFLIKIKYLFQGISNMKLKVTEELLFTIFQLLFPKMIVLYKKSRKDLDCKFHKNEIINHMINQCIYLIYRFQIEVKYEMIHLIQTILYLNTQCKDKSLFYEYIIAMFVESSQISSILHKKEWIKNNKNNWKAHIEMTHQSYRLKESEIKKINQIICELHYYLSSLSLL